MHFRLSRLGDNLDKAVKKLCYLSTGIQVAAVVRKEKPPLGGRDHYRAVRTYRKKKRRFGGRLSWDKL